MKTFQEAFYLETRNPLRRLWRNIRLLGYILQMIWFWGVLGGRVRRAVRRSRQTGEPFYIDHLGQAARQNTAKRASEERARITHE